MPDLLTVKDAADEDRFARLRLISWWDQQRLSQAKFLVIGAGRLGNEILKNLALLGVGNVLVADRDRIENSNLSRSVLFRGEDCGLSKADVAAARAREIYPGMRVQPLTANIVHDLGRGLPLGRRDPGRPRQPRGPRGDQSRRRPGGQDLDRRRDRTAPRRGPGLRSGLRPVLRVYDERNRLEDATGPAKLALLTRDDMEEGKVPTVSTTASVIAGIQCQEAVKLIHGLDVLAGRGFVFEGMTHSSYVVAYTRKDDCPAHDPDEPVQVLPLSIAQTSTGDFLERVRSDLGPRP